MILSGGLGSPNEHFASIFEPRVGANLVPVFLLNPDLQVGRDAESGEEKARGQGLG